MEYKCSHIIGSLFLLSCLTACRQTWHVSEVKVDQYQISDLPDDSTINAIIEPYRQLMKAEMNEVIGTCAVALTLEKPESSLGNFVADVLYERYTHYYGPIDFATTNYGGLRINTLPAGPITRGKIFELMPFDNKLVVLKLKGSLVKRLFNFIADYGGWPVSKQVRFRIENKIAVDVSINGEPLDQNRYYTIALPDFIANGGGYCEFLIGAERVDLDNLVRDLILDFVKTQTEMGKEIWAEVDGRIR